VEKQNSQVAHGVSIVPYRRAMARVWIRCDL